jgi:uncharacterized protein YdhG (YjbR/CyaY superfamily)
MSDPKTTFTSIDEYIASFPEDVQVKLQQMRAAIQVAAPQAQEKISYQMPTFFLHGNLVHFAAFKKHIGFYPTPSGIASFAKELAGYQNAKGSVQFPLDQPLPLALIGEMVKFRVAENLKAAEERGKGKKVKAR